MHEELLLGRYTQLIKPYECQQEEFRQVPGVYKGDEFLSWTQTP